MQCIALLRTVHSSQWLCNSISALTPYALTYSLAYLSSIYKMFQAEVLTLPFSTDLTLSVMSVILSLSVFPSPLLESPLL